MRYDRYVLSNFHDYVAVLDTISISRHSLLVDTDDSANLEVLQGQEHEGTLGMPPVCSHRRPIYRPKLTFPLSRLMWATSGLLCGVYAIVRNINMPIIAQPQIFSSLTLLSFAQVRVFHVC